MSITSERLPGESIVIYHYPERLHSTAAIYEAVEAAQIHLQAIQGPVWIIHNAAELKLDFGELVTILGTLVKAASVTGADTHVRIAVVSSSELVQFGAEAAGQEQYGNFNVHSFNTCDEAIAHARHDLAQSGT